MQVEKYTSDLQEERTRLLYELRNEYLDTC